SKMKVLLHGDSPFEWQVALSFYRRSASKGYFYACSSLSSTTGYTIFNQKNIAPSHKIKNRSSLAVKADYFFPKIAGLKFPRRTFH
ncbi:hypothetical protein, partial [Geobacillus stearothermophilus]